MKAALYLIAAILTAALLAGCGLRHVLPNTILPTPDLDPLGKYGYSHKPDDHLFFLELAAVNRKVPTMVEHVAFFFDLMRYERWCLGPYCRHQFWSFEFFPGGRPTEAYLDPDKRPCAFQVYGGIKTEGTIAKEMQSNGYRDAWPLEFKPSEQLAFRIKCDLDVRPRPENMAGY